MNIVLLGYGKMGKLIEEVAKSRGHHLVARIDENTTHLLDTLDTDSIDVAIEFSQPEAALSNISWALRHQIPVVSGTTGWLQHKAEMDELAIKNDCAFFYASNFSIGVNILFKVNEFLASLMNEASDYQVSIEEIHHTEKKDAPSGTAITLAQGIIKQMDQKNQWHLEGQPTPAEESIPIRSLRVDPAPGTHHVRYQSSIDDLEISHTAHSRKGFVLGAVLVAEWILDKKGILSMNDFLSF